MPNPVLLSANIDHSGLKPKVVTAADGSHTPLWRIEVPVNDVEPKPLWILDGQHRISGLSRSSQADNPIPVVLLLNTSGQSVYSGRDFAHIFAQVTVTAKGLDSIHEEWLTYSYELERYAPGGQDSELHRAAFETVAYLCGNAGFENLDVNPWLNGVVFNPGLGSTPPATLAGFHYSSPELKDLVLKHYYRQVIGAQIDPEDLASEIARAYVALEAALPIPKDESVFLGKGTHAHKVLQDGFLIGVLRRLAHFGVPNSWLDVLKSLNFHKTDWNFSTWAKTRGGNAGNTSRRLAETIFPRVMIQGSLPVGIDNLADYFRGNDAFVTVICRHVNGAGKPVSKDPLVITLKNGNKQTRDIGARRHVRILKPGASVLGNETASNVGKIEAFEPATMGRPKKHPELIGRGLNISLVEAKSLEVDVVMEHYGAELGSANLTIKWT